MTVDHSRSRRSVGIAIFDDVEVLDFAGPYEVFSRTRLVPGVESRRTTETAPFEVFTVAPSSGAVRATGGLRVIPDFTYDDAPKIDVLVIPGGFGTRRLLDDPTTISWIQARARESERVASVCTGALLLARAGLLQNSRATTHWGALDLLATIDPSIRVERAARVVADTIVTSAGVSAGIDMSLCVVEALHGRAVADETARYIEFGRGRCDS
jgi:transcriptional regulator GlxA family with amidase domain